MRVYEVAKEFGVESKEVLAALGSIGEDVRSASSKVDPRKLAALSERLRGRFPMKDLAPSASIFCCRCCNLQQQPHVNQFGVNDQVCGSCLSHQGEHKALKRAESHEALLRERMGKASEAAQEAYKARNEYKEKMRHAYASRDRAVEYLTKINDRHQLRGDGTCSCGSKRCPTAELIYERWPQAMIKKLEQREASRDVWDE